LIGLCPVAQAEETDSAQTLEPIRFQVLGDLNWGHRLGDVLDEGGPVLKSYLEELVDGFSFGLTGGGFFTDKYGAGLHINRFSSSHKEPNIRVTQPNGQVLNGMSDDISMWFIGPVLLEKHEFAKNQGFVLFEAGAGFLAYSDEGKVGNQSVDISASAFSFMGAVKVAFRNHARGAMGIQFRFLAGSFDSGVVNGVEVELSQRESINRFDLGLVLGFAH
jgi:hypothetical protein